jgi:hypothetical protein
MMKVDTTAFHCPPSITMMILFDRFDSIDITSCSSVSGYYAGCGDPDEA